MGDEIPLMANEAELSFDIGFVVADSEFDR